MLIKCPECGKDISNESEKCIHCGYPLNRSILGKNICIINGVERDLTEQLENISNQFYKPLLRLVEEYGMSLEDASVLTQILKVTKQVPREYDSQKRGEYRLNLRELENCQRKILKCPKCGSTLITAGQRGYNVLTGFIGSSKTMNRCANCGYKWKPKG